jgi:hypothetical protein
MEAEYTAAISLGKRVIPVLIDSTPLPMGLCDFQALDMRGLLAQSHDAKLDELAAYVRQREARQGVAVTSAGVAPPDWLFEAARAFAILADQPRARPARQLRVSVGNRKRTVPCFVVASVLIIPIMSVVLTASNAPGTRVLELGLGSDHLLMLPRIAMMWLRAAVVAQGSAMAERSAAV